MHSESAAVTFDLSTLYCPLTQAQVSAVYCKQGSEVVFLVCLFILRARTCMLAGWCM